MSNKEPSLTELLNRVIPVCVYKGVLVKKLIGGFEVFGQKVSKISEVEKLISQSEQAIQNSIK